MNITRENTNELNATITVKIEKNDYEATVSEALKDYRKKANMPGFRPGKVPAGLIKKMYGKSVLAEEVNKMLGESLSKYLVDEKLNILGDPIPNDEKQQAIDFDSAVDFEFFFDVAIAPEIEVKLDKRKKFTYFNILVDDEMINKQAESYTGHFGENVKVDISEDKDTLRGDFIQLDENGSPLEEGIKTEGTVIAVDLVKDEAIKKEMIGKKVGDTIVFDPIKAYESKDEVGHMLNIPKEEAEKIEGNFSFAIAEVLRFKKAEINEDLFKKAFGEETEIKTEEQFRNKLKGEIQSGLLHSSDYKFNLDCRESLVEKIQMELPEEFLKRWLKASNKEMTAEQIDSEFGNFLNDLRWQLIKGRISKDNEIEVSEENMLEFAKKLAASQFAQYGMHNVPDEQLVNYAGHILKDENERMRVATNVQEDKILEVIKSKVTIDEKEISQEEFTKMLEK